MSTAVASATQVPTTTNGGTIKKKSEAWTPKELKQALKENKQFYRKVAVGLSVVPPNDQYVNETKQLAQELLDDIAQYEQDYKELYESTETKRVAGIKPKRCDRKLTQFFERYYKRRLPEVGNHGVCDLNRVAPRALCLYVKERGLGETQFFTLDEDLANLFNSPSIEDPSKTYLQLAQDRIDVIRLERASKGVKTAPSSSADIIVDNGRITMNYSALKIITPKFGDDYPLNDPGQYVNTLEDFENYLCELMNQRQENAKKQSKK